MPAASFLTVFLPTASLLLAATGVAVSKEVPRDAAQAAEVSTVVWAVGDNCDKYDAPVDCDDVGRLIAQDTDTDAVLALGDLQYVNGSLALFNRYYDPKMGRGKGLKAKTYPAPGNHEYLTSGATGYFDYGRAVLETGHAAITGSPSAAGRWSQPTPCAPTWVAARPAVRRAGLSPTTWAGLAPASWCSTITRRSLMVARATRPRGRLFST